MYRTDINIAGEFDEAPSTSSYSILVRIFRLVEKEGWDAACISWLLHFHLLKTTDRHPKSLFGSVDEQVFCFIKNALEKKVHIISKNSKIPRKNR